MARILVVDDWDLMRVLLRSALEAQGHEILEATNGLAALERCREDGVDLVITDLSMPVRSGLELIGDLRGEFPGLGIIAVSGGDDGALASLALASAAGARRTFQKPFSVPELLRAVTEILGADGTAPHLLPSAYPGA